jgi:hypothetical protein
LGLLRLFGLLPVLRGRNTNPVLTGGLTILVGLALLVVGIVLNIAH